MQIYTVAVRLCILGDNGCRHVSVVTPVARSTGALSCYQITMLRYADNGIVNIMKVYIERTNLQLELIRFSKQMLNLFTFTFAKRWIRPRKAQQEVSNSNHLGSVADRSRPIRGRE